VKDDDVRCSVKCIFGGCEFLAFVSKVGGTSTYKLKALVPKHTCGRVFNNKNANARWVAKVNANQPKKQREHDTK